MNVSLVIPTFNRASLLRETLPAFAAQNGAHTYEVIFVSNGSTDETEQVMNEWTARHPDKFRYFRIEPTGGPSAPRNAGIRAARHEVILILDDDVMPEPDLVRKHAEFHASHPEPEEAAVGEVYIPERVLSDPMSFFHTLVSYDEQKHLPLLRWYHFWTCNVSFKRQFMLDHGMFDERFLYWEDLICGHKLAQAGMRLRFVEGARGENLHHLAPAAIAAKGALAGRWLFEFLELIPERVIKERFGILSLDLPKWMLLKRSIKRAGLWVMENSIFLGLLRLLGATNGRRSRVSDLYYYVIFRRSMLKGFRQARRDARAGRRLIQQNVKSMIETESST